MLEGCRAPLQEALARAPVLVAPPCAATRDRLPQGPQDTPFAGGRFELGIRVPDQYPLVPPAVHFKTKIFHPNIHFKVCRDLWLRRVHLHGLQ